MERHHLQRSSMDKRGIIFNRIARRNVSHGRAVARGPTVLPRRLRKSRCVHSGAQGVNTGRIERQPKPNTTILKFMSPILPPISSSAVLELSQTCSTGSVRPWVDPLLTLAPAHERPASPDQFLCLILRPIFRAVLLLWRASFVRTWFTYRRDQWSLNSEPLCLTFQTLCTREFMSSARFM